MSGRFWISLGAVSAGLAVVAGAVGTHVLREVVHTSDADLQLYEVAVRYQMYHSIALVLVGLVAGRADSRWLSAAGIALALGILLFSGGLYARVLMGVHGAVHVVPFGGFAWIAGWLLLAIGALRRPSAAP
jgi:uncharacterized membrane protein YgdD (TMEM256/DUF423 family)